VATTAEPTPTLAQKIRGIWVVGGVSGTTVSTTVDQLDLFDPVTGIWYPAVTSFTTGSRTPVCFAGAVGYERPLDGHHLILVFGGFDSTGAVRTLVQIYDIESNAWSTGTPLPSARANIYAARVDEKVYILGGTTAAAAVAWSGTAAPVEYNHQYSIGGDSWIVRVDYAAARNSERFTYVYNDIVYNIGGRSAAAAVTASAHDGYSNTSNLLTTGATEVLMATPRTGVSGALRIPATGPAQILLLGGFSALTDAAGGITISNCIMEAAEVQASTSSNLFQYLNYPFVAPSSWQAGTAYPVSIGFGAAAIYGNTFYNFGGTLSLVSTPSRNASGSAAAYYTDLTTLPANTWTSITNMPVGRYGHSAVTFPQ
jgi:hypothetical protein